MKYLIAKSISRGNFDTDEFHKAMIEFWKTPRANGLSPAQIVYGRPMRLHVVTHRRVPCVVAEGNYKLKADRKAVRLKLKARERYDRHSRSLPYLPVGAIVRIQLSVQKRWQNVGEIINERHGGRSFLVRSETGRIYWRNQRFLKFYSPSP